MTTCLNNWNEWHTRKYLCGNKTLFLISVMCCLFIHANSSENYKPKNRVLTSESAVFLKFFNHFVNISNADFIGKEFSFRLSLQNLEESGSDLPEIQISILDNENYEFVDQKQFGHLYNPHEYVILNANLTHVEHYAYIIEFVEYTVETVFGHSYVLPFSSHEGSLHTPIIGANNSVIGHIRAEYFIIHPIRNYTIESLNDEPSNVTGLYIGHRGIGVGRRTDLPGNILENTIEAFNYACSHKADMVELDVQVSRDNIAVIYHDFLAKVFVKRRLDNSNYDVHHIPVHDLTYEQMQIISPAESDSLLMSDSANNRPFQTLKSVLEKVDQQCGINVEIKYPMIVDGEMEGPIHHRLNEYVDIILQTIDENVGNREVFITSFHPDLCAMVRYKQNKYRVAFLTTGHEPTVELSTYLAQSLDFFGVVSYAHPIISNRSLIDFVKSRDKALFLWGGDLNSFEVIEQLRNDGVDGLIFDNIDKILPQDTSNAFALTISTYVVIALFSITTYF